MGKSVVFEGKTYQFPDDATDQEIATALGQHTTAPPPAARNDLAQWTGVAGDALAPYGVAAATGAAIGAPEGGVGAVPGAAAGVTSMGLGDLASLVWNNLPPVVSVAKGRTFVTRPHVTPPSEVVRTLTRGAHLTAEPATAEQRIFHSALSSGAGAFTGASSAAELAQMQGMPNYMRQLLTTLGQQRGVQAAAGAAAGAAPQAAAEAGVTDPKVLAAISLGAGAAAGMAGDRMIPTPKGAGAPTAEALQARAQAAYAAATKAGVKFANPSKATTQPVEIPLNPKDADPFAMDLPTLQRQAGYWQHLAEEAQKAADAAKTPLEIKRAGKQLKAVEEARDAVHSAWATKDPAMVEAARPVLEARSMQEGWRAELDKRLAAYKDDPSLVNQMRVSQARLALAGATTAEDQAITDYHAKFADLAPKANVPPPPKPDIPPDLPQFYKGLVADVKAKVGALNFDAAAHPRIADILGKVLGGVKPAELTWDRMRTIVRGVDGMLKGASRDEKRIGRVIKDTIDEWMANPANAVGGDTAAAAAAHATATRLTRQVKGSEDIRAIITAAQKDTQRLGGSSNLAANLQRRFRQLADNPTRMAFFSKAEQEAIKDMAKGGGLWSHFLNAVGLMAPGNDLRGSLMAAGQVAGGLAGGAAPAAVSAVAGLGARAGSNAMALNRARAVDLLIRGGPGFKAQKPPRGGWKPGVVLPVVNSMAAQ